MLTVDVVINHARIEWSRSIECNGSDNVLEAVGLKSLQKLFKSRGFKLEYTIGIARSNQSVNIGVIQANGFNVEFAVWTFGTLTRSQMDVLFCVGDDGECFQTQEVKLNQTCFFNFFFGELGEPFRLVYLGKSARNSRGLGHQSQPRRRGCRSVGSDLLGRERL